MKKTSVSSQSLETFRYPKHKYPKNEYPSKPQKVIFTKVRQLFVGNLPFRVRWQDLKDLFRKVGNIERADVVLNSENKSKGHGTVLFATIEDAQRAIDMYNNYKWHGRILEVRGDRGYVDPEVPTKTIKGSRTRYTNRNKTSDESVTPEEGNKQLYVGNLSYHCQWQDLKDLLRKAGNIVRVDIACGADGRSRGFGTALFGTHEGAKRAIVLFNGYEFHNRPLKVHFDKFASDYKQPEDSVMDLPSSNVLDSMDILRQTYLPLPSPPQQPPQTTSYPDMYPEYSASLESSLLQEQERQNRLAFINNALALPLQYPGLSTPMYSNSSHSQAPMMYDNYLNNMPQYIYPYTPGGFMMSPQQSWLQQTPVSMPEPHTEMCTPMPFIKQDIATSAGLISRDESIKGYSLSGFT